MKPDDPRPSRGNPDLDIFRGGGVLFEPRASIRRWIKFESELDPDFRQKITQSAYGEKLFSCIQCGTCSATCPVSHYMDFTPRRIIAMVREGFKEDVLNCVTIWLCASCYACTVDCPRKIKITEVMYALKREAIAAGVYPKRMALPILSQEFFNEVKEEGKNSEGRVLLKLYLKTRPLDLLKFARLGLRLFLSGRMSLKGDRIKDRAGLKRLLAAVEQAREEVRP